jgi:hypothetical protein
VAALALALFFIGDLSEENVARHVENAWQQPLPVPSGPFDVAPRLEGEGTVIATSVRTNHFDYDYAVRDESLLVAPQLTPSVHLVVEGDGVAAERDGHFAIRVNHARGHVRLRFSDPLLAWSAFLSIVAWLGLGVIMYGDRFGWSRDV